MLRDMPLNQKLKLALVIWAIAYPVIACGPAAITEGGISGLIGSSISFFLGPLLLVPWLLGLVVLGGLVWLTGSRRGR